MTVLTLITLDIDSLLSLNILERIICFHFWVMGDEERVVNRDGGLKWEGFLGISCYSTRQTMYNVCKQNYVKYTTLIKTRKYG